MTLEWKRHENEIGLGHTGQARAKLHSADMLQRSSVRSHDDGMQEALRGD